VWMLTSRTGNCSIARALEVVGERWTLLIVRDAFSGLRRFNQFQESLGIARNVLTDRLNRLVQEGILERVRIPPRRTPLGARARDRWMLSGRAAYGLAAGVIGVGLFASLTPSPLYRSYSVLFHFSSLTLTLIFATYAFGVLTTLLLAGAVSDQVGRRPVLITALAGLMGAAVLFLVADSAAWLFVARGLQGLATGAAVSAGSAALLDLHPRRDPTGVALTNATAAAAGIGLGMLVSSSLVQIGWEPRRLPYLALLALIGIALAGAYLMPEPVRNRSAFRLTIARPRVPAVVRRPFILAALAVLSTWSIGSLFFSLGPELGTQLFGTSNAIVAGIGVVALAAAAVVAQLLTGRSAPWVATSIGSLALAAGIILIVVAAAIDSSAAYLAGSILGGAGFGSAYLGGLRALVAQIPPRGPSRRHVRVLRRRVRIPLGARDPRRHRRLLHLARVDVRNLRQRRRRNRSRRRLRSLAHPPHPSDPAHRGRGGTP
jgi:MFS family permease